jgi:CheY-like chemotaxis protein
MSDFTLLGHSCPSSKYPAIVLPVGRRNKKLVVLYQGAEVPDQEEEIPGDYEFVRYKPPLRTSLTNFDPTLQRLFAYDADDVITYGKDDEAQFFQEFLMDEKYSSIDPFIRFSFAHLAGDSALLLKAIGQCLTVLAERTPRFSATWVKNEAVQAMQDIAESPQKSRVVASRRLLIIDDDPPTTAEFKNLFTTRGYSVRTAGDGLEGLEISREWQPHVILLDLAMPKLNGQDFIERLRSENSKIPIIILSGHDEFITSRVTGAPGVTRVFKKSEHNLPELIEAVNRSGISANYS